MANQTLEMSRLKQAGCPFCHGSLVKPGWQFQPPAGYSQLLVEPTDLCIMDYECMRGRACTHVDRHSTFCGHIYHRSCLYKSAWTKAMEGLGRNTQQNISRRYQEAFELQCPLCNMRGDLTDTRAVFLHEENVNIVEEIIDQGIDAERMNLALDIQEGSPVSVWREQLSAARALFRNAQAEVLVLRRKLQRTEVENVAAADVEIEVVDLASPEAGPSSSISTAIVPSSSALQENQAGPHEEIINTTLRARRHGLEEVMSTRKVVEDGIAILRELVANRNVSTGIRGLTQMLSESTKKLINSYERNDEVHRVVISMAEKIQRNEETEQKLKEENVKLMAEQDSLKRELEDWSSRARAYQPEMSKLKKELAVANRKLQKQIEDSRKRKVEFFNELRESFEKFKDSE